MELKVFKVFRVKVNVFIKVYMIEVFKRGYVNREGEDLYIENYEIC